MYCGKCWRTKMKHEDHIKDGMPEVHAFLDQFYSSYGADHRVVFHHRLGVRLMGKVFGPDAMPIAEKHIRDDWGGKLPASHKDTQFYRDAWAEDILKFRDAIDMANQIFGKEGFDYEISDTQDQT
jgi:hypothetical protein